MNTPQEILKGVSREAAKAELESYAMRRMHPLRTTSHAAAFRSNLASALSAQTNDGGAARAHRWMRRFSPVQEIAQLHAEQDNLENYNCATSQMS